MTKTYTYQLQYKGEIFASRPAISLVLLQAAAYALADAIADKADRAGIKRDIRKTIAELKSATSEEIRLRKIADNERIAKQQNQVVQMPGIESLREPGKPLSHSYAYVKAWRASKGLVVKTSGVALTEKQIKRKRNKLNAINEELNRLRGAGSAQYTKLNKEKKALIAELEIYQ